MKRAFGLCFLLVGCTAIQDKIEEIEDYTNGFVVGSYYFGVEENEYLEGTPFEENAQIQVYLASSNVSSDLDSNPASRADVLLNSNSMTNFSILEGEAGEYSSSSSDGLQYVAGEDVTLDITHATIPHAISVNTPLAPVYTLPDVHSVGAPLSIDLSGQEFHETLAVVMKLQTGEITFDKRPQNASEMYELSHPDEGALGDDVVEVTTVDIDGTAFPEENFYLVGIAGVRAALPDDMEDVNPLLSGFVAGKFKFSVICIPDCAGLDEMTEPE